jgi:formate dehydrogenase major subunit
LNETAKFAHVFFPGSSFLEKDGTFTNAERRISRVSQAMPPMAGLADWEVTLKFAKALGYEMSYEHPEQIMQEIADLTPSFRGVSYEKIERLGSVQWPCNENTEEAGTPIMHIDKFVRGKGKFFITQYIASDEKVTQRFPLLLTTGRILSQYNVGAQTRRTHNNLWHDEDLLEIHPHDAQERGIKDGTPVGIESRVGRTVLNALVSERMQPGVVYTTFHFPDSGANVITTDSSDWATNCPEYKVTAVQVVAVKEQSDWQERHKKFDANQLKLLAQGQLKMEKPEMATK